MSKRKIFLDELPKYKFRNKYRIDWIHSIGCKVSFIYEDVQGEVEILKYIKGKHPKLKIKYENNCYEIDVEVFKSCGLGRILGKITYDFKLDIGDRLIDNERDLTIIDRKYIKGKSGQNYKYYKYKCNKCGFECGEHWANVNRTYNEEYCISESGLLKHKSKCACCTNSIVVKGINDIATTNPNLIPYFVNVEDTYSHNRNSKHEVLCRCLNCNNTKNISICNLNRNMGIHCDMCSDGISYPNKFMYNLLKQLKIDFINEYSPQWANSRIYDFYIPSKRLIIEMDGEFHERDNTMSGQTKEQSKEIDNYKDMIAKEQGLKVIRIKCHYKTIETRFEYIKENVINTLNYIFKLDEVDWNEINNISTESLIKQVCDYWNDRDELEGTKELADAFGLSKPTIIHYLKCGTELGICNYDVQESNKNRCEKSAIARRRPIKMFKDDKCLGVFSSANELENKSEELFGVKLLQNNIRAVANGHRKSYRGFTFQYITKEEYKLIK